MLCGLQGLGAEVAKNLVLTGVGSLTLHDPHPTCWADLAAQCFLSEESLGRNRAEASQAQLAQLNEAVQISVHSGDITEDLLQGFQVVVLTDSKLEDQLKVGPLCHKHGVRFLMAETRGLVGRLFCDFGEDFTVLDPTEVEPMTAAIQDISQGFPGIVTLRGDTKRHSFHDGDLVIFSDIEGMVELNSCSPQSVRVQKDGSLEIGDTTTFSRYLRGGVVTEVKRPKTVRHKPLDIALLQPHVVAQNTQEVQRAHCLHQAFHVLHKFQQLHGRLPKPWDPDDAETVVELAQDLEPLKGTEEESLDEALLRTIALSSAGTLSPMAAIMGGVAAQEVLKAISRKFMPLDQWLYFDALECLPEDETLLPSPEDCQPRNCRYDGQIAVFGTDLQEKLSDQHYLLVGAGAIGCEMLKVFALVGLGVRANGGVTVADMDYIERSNLSRQFLFRPKDVRRPKAEVAAAAAHRLNPDLRATPYTCPLDPTTEDIYDDSFFSRVNGVVAALDSFQARHYVAARCTHYLKPLLEAGTQGTWGSASVFVPYVTEAYRGPASDAASEDAPYPVCTLRHIPSSMEHSVQWAQDQFEGLFRLSTETINCYQQTCTSLSATDRTETLALLQQVMGVLRTRPQTWQDCVVWALGHWQLCFHDKVLEGGTQFSSGSNKCPHPLQFDPNHDMHFLYVLAAANLYARMHGLPGSQSQPALRELLTRLLESDSRPQNLFSAEHGQEQLKELQETLDDWRKGPPLKPVLFVKDDDSNFHVDFVVAATDLRCQNYGILPVNHARIKQIVGRIIPAIATSTAVVAGLLGLELYKVVSGLRSHGTFRHSYLHLAENHFIRSAPSAPAVQSFRDLKWTCWDRLKVPAVQPERTLKSLLAHLQEEHGLKVEMLLHHQALLYSSGWSSEKQAQHLCLRVTELVQHVTGWKPKPGLKVLVFELSCEGEEEEMAFPPLHYEL